VVEAKVKSAEENKIEVVKESITADSPIPFSIKRLWFELDDFERQTFTERARPETITQKTQNGDAEKLISNLYQPASAGGGSPFLNNQAKGLLGFLDSMRTRLNDSSYSFLFNPGKFNPDLNGKIKKDLDYLFLNWLGNDLPITILD